MDRHSELPKELKHLAWLSLDEAAGQEYWAAMNLMGHYAAANHALIHKHIAKKLAGTLVLQRALPLLQYEYPILAAITQDYSDAPGLYGQTETTRITLKPAVQSFNSTVDSAGHPLGWSTVSPAQSVDVNVTLDEHVGVPIVFGQHHAANRARHAARERHGGHTSGVWRGARRLRDRALPGAAGRFGGAPLRVAQHAQ